MRNRNAFEYRKKYVRERMVIQEDTRIVRTVATIFFPDACFKSRERYHQFMVSLYQNGLLGIVKTSTDDGNVSFKLDDVSFLKLWDYYEKGFPVAEVIITYKPFFIREDEAAAWVYDRMEEIFEWLRK